MKRQLLLLEQDSKGYRALFGGLPPFCFDVDRVNDEGTLVEAMQKKFYALVIVDTNQLSGDIPELIAAIRVINPEIPVFLIGDFDDACFTGRPMPDLGITFFFCKPVQSGIMAANIRSAMQLCPRLSLQTEDVLAAGVLLYDLKKDEVYLHDEMMMLNSREKRLLQFYLQHPAQIFDYQEINEKVFTEAPVPPHVLSRVVNTLDKKLKGSSHRPENFFEKIPGGGICFKP